MNEFDLIKHFFSQQSVKRKDVIIGIGDDCAVLQSHDRKNMAVTTDTLVNGVHFPENTSARAVGHKSVAVSLSDLAAMGAEPAWISLALTMPSVDKAWLREFSAGVFELCEYYNVQLIGGDTTKGPLSITVTAQGFVPADKHITRSGAKVGDWIYVTGTIGDAALALMHVQNKVYIQEPYLTPILSALDFPKPRVLVGQMLRDYASAALDISDGLLADLKHLCTVSNVGANVALDAVPISAITTEILQEQAIAIAINGGDDYELLFTVSETNKVGMETAMAQTGVACTCIGQINHSGNITTTINNKLVDLPIAGYEHFSK